MSYNCPKCNSEHIQRFPVVYERGISNNQSDTTGIGVGVGTGGLGFGVGKASTSSTSMTAIAERLAPPAKKKVPWWAWLIGVSGLGTFGSTGLSASDAASVGISGLLGVAFCFLPTLLPIVYLIFVSKWNANEWPVLYAEWKNSWLCQRCGYEFVWD